MVPIRLLVLLASSCPASRCFRPSLEESSTVHHKLQYRWANATNLSHPEGSLDRSTHHAWSPKDAGHVTVNHHGCLCGTSMLQQWISDKNWEVGRRNVKSQIRHIVSKALLHACENDPSPTKAALEFMAMQLSNIGGRAIYHLGHQLVAEGAISSFTSVEMATIGTKLAASNLILMPLTGLFIWTKNNLNKIKYEFDMMKDLPAVTAQCAFTWEELIERMITNMLDLFEDDVDLLTKFFSESKSCNWKPSSQMSKPQGVFGKSDSFWKHISENVEGAHSQYKQCLSCNKSRHCCSWQGCGNVMSCEEGDCLGVFKNSLTRKIQIPTERCPLSKQYALNRYWFAHRFPCVRYGKEVQPGDTKRYVESFSAMMTCMLKAYLAHEVHRLVEVPFVKTLEREQVLEEFVQEVRAQIPGIAPTLSFRKAASEILRRAVFFDHQRAV